MVNCALSIATLIIVVIAVGVIAMYGGLFGAPGASPSAAPTASATASAAPSSSAGASQTPSPTRSPSATPFSSDLIASAIVVPIRSADLALPASGVVEAIFVRPDQQVTAGQLLLRLDQGALAAQAMTAQDEVDRAHAAVDRATKELAALPLDASQAQIELAQADLRLAQADLALTQSRLVEAQTALEETDLRAPIAGTITSIDVGAGEQADAGETLMTIADMSGWLIETTDVTELEVVRIGVGDPATVTFPALPGIVLTGVVDRIQVRGTTETGDVRFAVSIKPDTHLGQLRWNMTANVVIVPRG